MEFKLKHAATDYDIPLAAVLMKEVKASDIIQTFDFSHELTGNPIAAFRLMETFPDGGNVDTYEKYRLVSDNLFGKVLITDEFVHEKEFGTKVPLWYAHPLRHIYVNPNTIDRVTKRSVRQDHVQSDRIVPSLIPTEGSYVIVTGSVKVYTKDLVSSSPQLLGEQDYYVDYALGSVTVSEESMYIVGTTPIYEFNVEYKIAPVDIRVQTTEKVIYRFELMPLDETTPGYFTVNILSNTDHQFYVIYRSQLGPGTVEEIQEHTTAIPLFTDVPDAVRLDAIMNTNLDISAKRVFSRIHRDDIDYIYTTSRNKEHIIGIKPRYPQPNKITVKEPYIGNFTSDWYMQITAGHIVSNEGEYKVEPSGESLFIREKARIISSRLISVSGNDLIVRLKHNGYWDGITVTRKIDNSNLDVVSVDAKNGIVEVSSDISRLDEIIIEYSIRTNSFIFEQLCFNPLSFHDHHNGDIKEEAIIICMIETDRVPHGRRHPIYFMYLDKYIGGRPATYTYELVSTWLNNTTKSVRNEYRENMGLPTEYYGDALIKVEPLALIQIANPLDSDAFEISDARVFGGGYRDKQTSFFDYSYYDGEGTDLESMLVIEVPEWIKTNLAARAKLWDPDVIKSDAPDQLSEFKAKTLIDEKAKKFSMIGTTQEVVIGTKTTGNSS